MDTSESSSDFSNRSLHETTDQGLDHGSVPSQMTMQPTGLEEAAPVEITIPNPMRNPLLPLLSKESTLGPLTLYEFINELCIQIHAHFSQDEMYRFLIDRFRSC